MVKKSTQSLLAFMGVVAALSPDNGYMNCNRCRDCCYYSEVPANTCELEHGPADPNLIACASFKPKEV